jgi:hypothetical protein
MTSKMVLELKPECLTQPIRMDLVDIEAMMLWPKDPQARYLWFRAASLEEGLARIDDMPVDLLRQYAKDAMTIPRVAELNKQNARRMAYGLVAGWMIFDAAFYAMYEPERAALYKVQESISEHLNKIFQIRPQTMKNTDGQVMSLKPAAHLWAAHAYFAVHGDRTFPCKLSDIGKFLSTAEAIREVAEANKAPKAKTTIMQPGETVTLPDAIRAALPATRLLFNPDIPEKAG